MKCTIPEYISTISDNQFEILEDIIQNKYFEFLSFYKLLKSFSSYITSLQYKEKESKKLIIEVGFGGNLDLKKVSKQLKSESDPEYVEINKRGDMFIIKISPYEK